MRSPRLVGSRALRAGAAAAFGFTLMVTAIGTVAAHAAPAVDCNRQGITWQNNHNGRYLEVRNSDTSPGANVDVAPWVCGANQMWIPVDDGVKAFGQPIGASYDAWTFDNYNSGYCVQDPLRNAQVYSEPCRFGQQQEFAEYGGPSAYELINLAGDQDMICEEYGSGSTDWAMIVPWGYPNWGTDKCDWH